MGQEYRIEPLRLLFIGTMEAQDRSGMLQALQRLTSQTTIFTKADGSYGLEFPQRFQTQDRESVIRLD